MTYTHVNVWVRYARSASGVATNDIMEFDDIPLPDSDLDEALGELEHYLDWWMQRWERKGRE